MPFPSPVWTPTFLHSSSEKHKNYEEEEKGRGNSSNFNLTQFLRMDHTDISYCVRLLSFSLPLLSS